FEVREPFLDALHMAFAELAARGVGMGRGRAELSRIEQIDLADSASPAEGDLAPISIGLDPDAEAARLVTVRFVTATELKDEGVLARRPEFRILFARLRDHL